jgi:hypothetical protein
MTAAREFFAYHPRRWRIVLTFAAGASLVLTAWALASAVHNGSALEFARAGISAGLVLAMLFIHLKLRPRAEWGVKVTPLALVVSRPTQGQIEIPWSAVKEIRREGSRRERLVIFVGEEKQVLVSQHLFPSRDEFEALASAIDEQRPSTLHDA